jgi:hypothetical protein
MLPLSSRLHLSSASERSPANTSTTVRQRIVLTLIELHADSQQNSCWLHSCEAADFVIDCAAKLSAQLIITGGGWQSDRGRVRGGPSRRAGADWRLPRYALPRPTDEALHRRDLHRLCYHDPQSWLGGWWRGGANSGIAKEHVHTTHILLAVAEGEPCPWELGQRLGHRPERPRGHLPAGVICSRSRETCGSERGLAAIFL